MFVWKKKKVGTRVILPSCRSAVVKEKRQKEKSLSLRFPQLSNLVISPIGKNPTIKGGYCKDSWLSCLQVTLKMGPNVLTFLVQEYFCVFTTVE